MLLYDRCRAANINHIGNIAMTRTLLLALLVTLPLHAFAQDISKREQKEVMAAFNKMQAANVATNVEAITAMLAPEFQLVREFESSVPTLDYRSYIAYIEEAFSLISDYNYRAESPEIFKLPDDNGFGLKVTMTETYQFDRRNFEETHSQTWHLRELDGSLRVTRVIVHD